MGKGKHTPGPWLYKLGPLGVLHDLGKPYHSAPGGTVYAETSRGLEVVAAFTQSEANARLIAAAPQMLEALKLMDETLSAKDGVAIGEAWELLRRAISEAEGRDD